MLVFRLLLTSLVLLASPILPLFGQSESVRIGVLAKRGEEKAHSQWEATANYLTTKIKGYHFEIVPLDFTEIGPAVQEERIDFILANSEFYVDFEMHYGASRIATLRNAGSDYGHTLFGGVIFTRADRNDVNSIPEITGKRFAAVEENSLGGFLMAWREMNSYHIDPHKDTKLMFAGTHDGVVEAVLEGRVDVGTVRTDTLERMAAEGKIDLKQFKVIHSRIYPDFPYLVSTDLYPEWPFARLKHTSETLSHAVATALLEMPPDSLAAKNGNIAGWTVPRNYQPIHDLMRDLHIGPYANLGKITLAALLQQHWPLVLLTLLLILVMFAVILYIGTLNVRLRNTEIKLIDARDNLSDRVRERTAELEESRARLERISRDWNEAFDAIDDPIFIHDSDMRIVQANPAYCRRAGTSLDALLGKRYFDHFPGLTGPLPACLNFPETLQSEGDELTLDSGEIYISRSFAIERADGKSHAIHILEDVTAERRAEQKRRTLTSAVDQAGEGMLLLDSEQRIIYCNPAFSLLIGSAEHDDNCTPPYEKIDHLVSENDRETLQKLFSFPFHEEARSTEVELLTITGGVVPVYMTVGRINGEQSVTEGYVVTAVDLSRLKSAEAQLTHRIALETLVGSLASHFVSVEPEGMDQALDESLVKLGKFSLSDRAYLFHYDETSDTISNTHEWCAEGVSSEQQKLQQIPFDTFPWLKEQLLRGESILINDVSSLPPEAIAEKEEFQREKIRSLMLLPLSYAGRFVGFFGFDFLHRSYVREKEDMRLLLTASGMIANTIGRIKAVEKLRNTEIEQRRLNRALRTLSRCNTTLVHAREEQSLLEAICNALIETGGYRFAWVGFPQIDEDKSILPVAFAGESLDYLKHCTLSWDEQSESESPPGFAIRRREFFIARNIGASPASSAWKEAALSYGYESIISLPLVSQGELLGVLSIYAAEPDAFDENELSLIEELTGDLSFGIHTLRSHQEHMWAEEALRATEQRYKELYENAPNGYVSVNESDGQLLQFNQALCDILGYNRSDLQRLRVFDIYQNSDEGLAKAKRIFSRFQNGDVVRDEELLMQKKNGEPVWVSVSIDPVFDETGHVKESRSMVINISERKRAEEEQKQIQEQLQRSLLQAIQAIALTIEKRDPYTAGHQERVAKLAVAIATELGLDEHRIEGIRLGALIHDIGKIAVPAEILSRPGLLPHELYVVIQTHPKEGHEIIRGIEFPWPLAEMVLQHHERLDGSGYPAGLKGDAILLESRILAVADVVEAMVSHRPYRAAVGVEAAMKELRDGKGTLFDPDIVEICLQFFGDPRYDWIFQPSHN